MSPPLREAAKRILPRAHLIIDRFCVMNLGNQAFETARERAHLHASRPKDVKVFVAAAYFLKARFIDVFRTDSSSVARRRYAEWVAGVPEELMFAFGPVMRRVNNWGEQIFGYFDYHFSQANHEGEAGQSRPHRPSNVVPDLSRPAPRP
jgi:transposase